MTENTAQPTVLVKKADGTMARMTLEEVKKMQKAGKQIPRSSRIKVGEPIASQVGSTVLPTPGLEAIPAYLPVGKARAGTAKASDFSSPLEEPRLGTETGRPLASADRRDEVDKVTRALGFSAAPEHVNRLRTIIQLRLKDVRSEEQTREALERRPLDGGLGLEPAQAEEVLAQCRKIMNIPSITAVRKLNKSLVPATSAPNNAFAHPSRPVSALNYAGAGEPALRLRAEPHPTTMREVTPSAAPVGPVDEIRSFSLTDFRRLATASEQAASRLQQKFRNLREESILLYFKALEAWRQSPLFTDYITAVSQALDQGRSLTSAIADKKGIQPGEIEAIAGMNRKNQF